MRPLESSSAMPEASRDVNLATIARSALAADAVLLIDRSRRERPNQIAAAGLEPDEAEHVVTAIGRLTPTESTLAVPGFAVAHYHESRVPGLGAAAIGALNRKPVSFAQPSAASIFAGHAVIARAVRRHRLLGLHPAIAGDSAGPAWMLDTIDYSELNQAISDEVANATGATLAGVLWWDQERTLLCPVPGAFGSDPESLPPAHAAQDWWSSAARVFATGEPYLSNDAVADPGVLQDYVEAFGFQRVITVPMDVGQRRVGVLQIANKASEFTLADLDAAMVLGARIAIGVEVTQMRWELLRRQRLEEVLSSMAVQIASGRDLHEFLGAAMDGLCAIVRGSLVALIPFEGDAVVRRRRKSGAQLENMLLSQAKSATSLRVYGVGSRRAVEPGWSVVHVPVMLSGEQVATVSVMRRGGDFFDAEECRAFSRLANLIALGWSTEGYQRQLAEAARVAERQRIADALHDQVAQLLFGARLSLDAVAELTGVPDAAQEGVRRGRDLLLRADVATREIMERNSTTTDGSLPAWLEATVAGVEEEFGRPVTLEIADDAAKASLAMSLSAHRLLCRAVREALLNAIKHAGPCRLSVRVTRTRRNRLLATIADNGVGITERRGDGYGTGALRRSVRLHGGVLRVGETSTGGTKVAVSLPL